MSIDCDHKWRKIFEQDGCFTISKGWRCFKCQKFVDNKELTPTGLSGEVVKKEYELDGPGRTSDGRRYLKQVQYADGRVEIIYETNIGNMQAEFNSWKDTVGR